jgi:polyvinyl alcohol dehydrogenase (cytochrome)
LSNGKISGPGARVIAVNAKPGALLWATQVDRNPVAQITGSPVIYKGIVYTGVSSEEETFAEKTNYPCCTFQGSVVALDLRTGKILWQTYDMPPNGGRPGATAEERSGTIR